MPNDLPDIEELNTHVRALPDISELNANLKKKDTGNGSTTGSNNAAPPSPDRSGGPPSGDVVDFGLGNYIQQQTAQSIPQGGHAPEVTNPQQQREQVNKGISNYIADRNKQMGVPQKPVPAQNPGELSNANIAEGKAKLQQNPEDVNGITQLGYGYKEIGDNANAKNAFMVALQKDPTNQSALMNLGSINYKENNYQESYNNYEQAFKANPKNSDAALGMSTNLLQLSKSDPTNKDQHLQNAKKIADAVTSNDNGQLPINQNAWQLKASVNSALGDHEQAQKDLNNANIARIVNTPITPLYDAYKKQIEERGGSIGEGFENAFNAVGEAVLRTPALLGMSGFAKIGEGSELVAKGIYNEVKTNANTLVNGSTSNYNPKDQELNQNYRDAILGTLKVVGGGAQVAFSGGMMANPEESALFNTGLLAADEVTGGNASRYAFAPFSTMIPLTSETGKEIESMLDILPSMAIMHGMSKVINGDVAAKDDVDVAKKVNAGKSITGEQAIKFSADAATQANPESIKKMEDAVNTIPATTPKKKLITNAANLVISQTADQRIKELNEQINELVGGDNVGAADLMKVHALEQQLEHVNNVVDEHLKTQTPELTAKINELRTERAGLYQDTKGDQLQKDSDREQEINKELLNLLKQKQQVRNNLLNAKIQNDAVQISSPKSEISRTGTTGENIPQDSEGVGQGKQGQKPTQQGEPQRKEQTETLANEKEPLPKEQPVSKDNEKGVSKPVGDVKEEPKAIAPDVFEGKSTDESELKKWATEPDYTNKEAGINTSFRKFAEDNFDLKEKAKDLPDRTAIVTHSKNIDMQNAMEELGINTKQELDNALDKGELGKAFLEQKTPDNATITKELDNGKKVYLIRHGETPHDLKDLNSGQSEIGLAKSGKQEVNEENYPKDISQILTSPLERAKQTANIIRDKINEQRKPTNDTGLPSVGQDKPVVEKSKEELWKMNEEHQKLFDQNEALQKRLKKEGLSKEEIEKHPEVVKLKSGMAELEKHFSDEEPEQKVEPKTGKQKSEPVKESEPPKEPPKEKVKAEEGGKGDNVGVSHAALTELAQRLGLKEPEHGDSPTSEWLADRGRRLLDAGADPHEVNNPNNKLNDRISIARAHLEDLRKSADQIAKIHPDGVNGEAFKDALKEIDKYIGKVKSLGNEAHQAFVALQGRRDIDTGSFTRVRNAVEEVSGKPITADQQKKIADLTKQNEELQKQSADLEKRLIEATQNEFNKEGVQKKNKFAEVAKKAADVFRKLKTKPFEFTDENGVKHEFKTSGISWNDLVEYGAKAIEKTGNIADGVSAIIEKIKDSDLYKSFSEADKKKFEDKLTDHYKDLANNTPEANNIRRLEKELDKLQTGNIESKSGKRKISDREKELQEQIAQAKKELGLVPSTESPTDTERSNEDKLTDLQEKFANKTGNKFTPDESKAIWSYGQENYIDKGVSYQDMIGRVANDLGLSWKQTANALVSPKIEPISNAMWKKQSEYRRGQLATKNWVEAQNQSEAYKAWAKTRDAIKGLNVYGHGGLFVGTHAGMTLFHPETYKYTIPAFINGYKLAYGKEANYEMAVRQLKDSDNYTTAQVAGLQNNPDVFTGDDYTQSQTVFGKIGLAGQKGFTAVKILRQQLFDHYYDKLTDAQKADPSVGESIARIVNNATGATNWKVPEGVKELTFAGGMEMARWEKLTRNPTKATMTAIKALINPDKASAADKVFAKVWASRVGQQVGVMAGMLLANAALQNAINPSNKVNLLHPDKEGWLKFKFGNLTVDPSSGMVGTVGFIKNLSELPFESNKEKHGNTQDASGKKAIGYVRGKLAPAYSTLADLFTQTDYFGNPLPFSSESPTAGKHNLTLMEYASQRFPIPVADAFKVAYQSAVDNGTNPYAVDNVVRGIISGTLTGSTGFRVNEKSEGEEAKGKFEDEEIKSNPALKYFSDKGFEMPHTSLASESIKDKPTSTIKKISELPQKTQDKYQATHKDNFKKELSQITDRGYVFVNQYGQVALKMEHTKGDKYERMELKKLNDDQLAEVLNKTQSKATEQTKKQMFGQ